MSILSVFLYLISCAPGQHFLNRILHPTCLSFGRLLHDRGLYTAMDTLAYQVQASSLILSIQSFSPTLQTEAAALVLRRLASLPRTYTCVLTFNVLWCVCLQSLRPCAHNQLWAMLRRTRCGSDQSEGAQNDNEPSTSEGRLR